QRLGFCTEAFTVGAGGVNCRRNIPFHVEELGGELWFRGATEAGFDRVVKDQVGCRQGRRRVVDEARGGEATRPQKFGVKIDRGQRGSPIPRERQGSVGT